MNDAICGGLGRLLRTFFLLTPIGLALLLTCLPTSVSARSGGESKNPALVRCAAAIAGDRQVRASLDEEETARCIDLLVDELARFEPTSELQRGKPPPPPPSDPPARYWHAFISNGSTIEQESKLFMFGGSDQGDAVAADLWYHSEWDGGWRLASSGKSRPDPRAHVAWSCGAGQCVAAFGTRGSSLQDTWVYSEANKSWTAINCRRRFCPSARWGATMAYDPERAYHVLFGGYNFGMSMGDTHTFADGRWTSHIPSPPPVRRDRAAAVFVPLSDVKAVVMHGGLYDDSVTLDDMFAWNGSAWVKIESGASKPRLHSHSMIWDDNAKRLVVTGGYTDTDDTANSAAWYFRFSTDTSGFWTRDETSTFATCVAATDPGARMANDRANDAAVLFGGFAYQGGIVATDTLTVCALSDAPSP